MSDEEIMETQAGSKRMMIIVIAVAAAIVLLIGGIAIWRTMRSGAGQPVPAPRTMTFDDSSAPTEQPVGGEFVTVPADQIERAGIRIETAGEGLAGDSEVASSTGTVQSNSYRETPALTLAGGVVRKVNAELGDSVSKGQTLAVVFSDEFAAAQTKYITLSTEVANARQNLERRRRLISINQPSKTEYDQAARMLTAADANLDEMRRRHDRTSKLVSIGAASREELEQDTTKLRTAEAESKEARNRLSRAESLLSISQETRSDLEQATNALQNAESERAAARQKLLLYGLSPNRIDALRSVSQITSELAVVAPVSGTVTNRSSNVGEVVEANKEIVRVTDLGEVWVIAQVYEQQLARIAVGSGASISSDAFPDRIFRGKVAYIDPKFDETTRTAQVRVELANPDRQLKIGMYVRVAFGGTGDAERTVPTVPVSAVQTVGARKVVFLATADPTRFELRPVRLGTESNGTVTVLEGLKVGDRVVTDGSFMLRAEYQRSAN